MHQRPWVQSTSLANQAAFPPVFTVFIHHPSNNSMGNLPHLLHKIIPPTFVSLTHHHICVRSPPISTFCGIRRGRGSEASQSRAKGKDSRSIDCIGLLRCSK
ncbi:hypothetical protein C362_02958 [Cryptococcus neoformans Bt1]|nr:hypothetical protein C362_02958 [Cryptococcus neoformans var. grubii Bt1]